MSRRTSSDFNLGLTFSAVFKPAFLSCVEVELKNRHEQLTPPLLLLGLAG
jgi:hypothetical protein